MFRFRSVCACCYYPLASAIGRGKTWVAAVAAGRGFEISRVGACCAIPNQRRRFATTPMKLPVRRACVEH
eukprot:7437483-Alexandrium_andersonii.AAC.1